MFSNSIPTQKQNSFTPALLLKPWRTSRSYRWDLAPRCFLSGWRGKVHSPPIFPQSLNSLRPRGLQRTSLPCPSPSPRACSNPCPLSQWCHPTVSSSVLPFSSYLQSILASGLFQWVGSSYQVAKVLELQPQHQSFPWMFRVDFL